MAIAPDGLTAISASDDNTLKIWDLLSGQEVASFSGDGGFNCCAILPDGVSVVAGDVSGRVHFLRLEGMRDLGDAAGLNNPVSLFYSGLALAKQGQYEAALAKFTEVAEIRPDALIVWSEKTKALLELERYEQAICCLDLAIKIEPNQSYLWNRRGIALQKFGCAEEAISSYDRALELQPDDPGILDNRAYALLTLGRDDEAMAEWDKVLEIDPNYANASYSLLFCLAEAGGVSAGKFAARDSIGTGRISRVSEN